jgi:hypothetical protein
MIPALLALLPLALGGAAAIIASFTLDGESSLQGWTVAALGALDLLFAALGHTTGPLDLATVLGIVMFGGIAGAGWNPRGRGGYLVLGFAALIVGLLPHLLSILAVGSTVGASMVGGGGSLTWAVARASGFAAFLSSTGAVLLGVRRPARLPVGGLPARLYALHRAFGLTAVLAVAVHLIALWADSFVPFSWVQLLATPWTSSYRPFAVTLGFLAMISLLLTAASGALRRVFPGWRAVHMASYITFGLSVFHGLLAGSDSGSPLALLLYLSALVAVGVTLLRRFSLRTREARNPPRALGDPFGTSAVKHERREPVRVPFE